MSRVGPAVLTGVAVVVVVAAVLGAAAPDTHLALPKGEHARCEACHTPAGWRPARFAHERTSYPLLGQHQGVSCADCHRAGYDKLLSTSCASCHVDPHQQEFGQQCASCHTPASFEPLFPIEAHRRGGFPLVGRHAALPCEECHVEKRERTYGRNALACGACHARDAVRARLRTVDHGVAPFSSDSCQSCHVPLTFSGGSYLAHDRCFVISVGKHTRYFCAECHTGLAGARPSRSCSGGPPATCTSCHSHGREGTDRQHEDVEDYRYDNDRCVACHRTGVER